jgi:hypothetical protein
LLQACCLLVLVALRISVGSPHSRNRYDTMQQVLTRMEDRLDAIGFQLFEERTNRTAAERYFDERRRDPDYDQAYRQAWRALRESDTDVSESPGGDLDEPGSPDR